MKINRNDSIFITSERKANEIKRIINLIGIIEIN